MTLKIHDIGAANHIPKHLLTLGNESCFVHFDPDERGLNNLKNNYPFDKATKVRETAQFIKIALGDKKEKRLLNLAKKNTGSSFFNIENNNLEGVMEVEVWPHKEYIKFNNIPPPDVIKIDVEGFEMQVLKGIDLLDKTLRSVEVEVTLSHQSLGDIINLMNSKGFQIMKLAVHGDQRKNPRSFIRGKVHGLMYYLKLQKFQFQKCTSVGAFDSVSTQLLQIELVFMRPEVIDSDNVVDKKIRSLYHICSRNSSSARLKCGDVNTSLFDDLFFLR